MKRKLISIIITILLLIVISPIEGGEIEKLNISDLFFIQDGLVPPDFNSAAKAVTLSPNPGFYETSEYMIGSCAVSVIFLESNGVNDPSTEDWNTNEINQVKSEIQQALNWWKNQNANAGITFVYDWQTSVPTSYEPINRPSVFTDNSHEKLWVNEAMAYFGHTTGDWMYRTRTHNNAVRNNKGTNWGFTVFIVDSSNDADGFFSDGFPYCAWAYYGIFLVMTYDNGKVSSGGWGINRMDQVMAHETGHIFWATDEYNGQAEYSGYLNGADVEGSGCLMCNNNLCLSSGTILQVGWRDTDVDTIQDIIDTNPITVLNTYAPDPTSNTILTYTGSATVSPYQNNNPQPSNSHNSVTINKISNVQYRVDGGSWINAQSSDGSFNSYTESFTFTTSTLSIGTHTIEARAINSVGNADQSPSSDTVTITSGGNTPPNPPNTPSGPTTGTAGIPNTYATSTIDADGDQVKYGWDGNGDSVVDHWTSYYSSGATCTIQITWQSPGTYNVQVKAEDQYGSQSGFSQTLTVIITAGSNNPPNTPSIPSGPTSGSTGSSLTYQTSSIDIDGDKVKYGFDWDGNGIVDTWTGLYNSGATVSASHTWSSPGTYSVKVMAEDQHGAQSGYSQPLIVTITSAGNNAPHKPSISGPTQGKSGTRYPYEASTTDPDGDKIHYYFDWGDGTNSGWVGPYNSGQKGTADNMWSRGTYTVRVKAKDEHGLESVWSDPLSISMPKFKEFQLKILISSFLEDHPYLLLLVTQLLKR